MPLHLLFASDARTVLLPTSAFLPKVSVLGCNYNACDWLSTVHAYVCAHTAMSSPFMAPQVVVEEQEGEYNYGRRAFGSKERFVGGLVTPTQVSSN